MPRFKSARFALPLLLILSACDRPGADTPQSDARSDADSIEQSRATVQALAAGLSSELQAAMQSGGPAAAIEVCRAMAQPITENIRDESPAYEVSRVALRYRNPVNAPDDQSESVLHTWLGELEREQAIQPVVTRQEASVIVHHPIRLQANCLLCHGDPETFPTEVTQAIQTSYPDDRATGFEVGDLRGAFRIEYRAE